MDNKENTNKTSSGVIPEQLDTLNFNPPTEKAGTDPRSKEYISQELKDQLKDILASSNISEEKPAAPQQPIESFVINDAALAPEPEKEASAVTEPATEKEAPAVTEPAPEKEAPAVIEPATVAEAAQNTDAPDEYDSAKKPKMPKSAKIIIIILSIVIAALIGGLVYTCVSLSTANDKIAEQEYTISGCEDVLGLLALENVSLSDDIKKLQKTTSKLKAKTKQSAVAARVAAIVAYKANKDAEEAANNVQPAQNTNVTEKIQEAADKNTEKIAAFSTSDTGVLTKSNFIVCYQGHIESFYSSKKYSNKLASKAGMKVDKNGVYRDSKGFVCVSASSSQLKIGSYVNTSHGVARVYDYGSASGCLDLYTNW